MRVPAIVWIFLAASVPNPVAAQAVFKCLEGRSITYSSTPCEKLGLKQGGEIQDRVTTMPAPKLAPAKEGRGPGKKPSTAKSANDVDMPNTSTLKPLNPLSEKLAR